MNENGKKKHRRPFFFYFWIISLNFYENLWNIIVYGFQIFHYFNNYYKATHPLKNWSVQCTGKRVRCTTCAIREKSFARWAPRPSNKRLFQWFALAVHCGVALACPKQDRRLLGKRRALVNCPHRLKCFILFFDL